MSIFELSTSDSELADLRKRYDDELRLLSDRCLALNSERSLHVKELAALSASERYVPQKRSMRRRAESFVLRGGLPVPTFRYLVLAGGGGKGLVYPAVYAILEAAGFMNDIKAVAGSSAGALTAAAIACAADPQEVATATREARYLGMMVKGGRRYGIPQGPRLDTSSIGLDSGQEIYEMFRHLYLTAVRRAGANAVSKLPALVKAKKILPDTAEAARVLVEGRDDTLTFGKLASLAQADPSTFKSLTITGTRIKDAGLLLNIKRVSSVIADYVDTLKAFKSLPTLYTGSDLEPVYFDAQTTPDMEIALAARISMSLPFLFDPVKYDGSLHVDGGVTTNVPVEVFVKNAAIGRNENKLTREEQFQRKQRFGDCLIVVPENADSADSTKHMLEDKENNADSSFFKENLFGVQSVNLRSDWEKVHNASARNVFPVPHTGLATESFLMAKAPQICTAQIDALKSTLAFLETAVKRVTPKSPQEHDIDFEIFRQQRKNGG